MAKRVLVAGDSITKGALGVGYLPIIAARYPACDLVNLGQDGDTLSGIRNRTLARLAREDDYDLVVIAAGHNDVILTEFDRRSTVHRSIVRRLAKKGSVPAHNFEHFVAIYRDLVAAVRKATEAGIVITTMSCVNEAPESSSAQMRIEYNKRIRAVATETGVDLADVGLHCDETFEEQECRDYLMENLLALQLTDRWKSKRPERADRLSRARGLHLTIDGVHLNSRGAQIYANAIAPFLELPT